MKKVRYIRAMNAYTEQLKSYGGLTVMSQPCEDGIYRVTFSVCSDVDRFEKKIGRSICDKRMNDFKENLYSLAFSREQLESAAGFAILTYSMRRDVQHIIVDAMFNNVKNMTSEQLFNLIVSVIMTGDTYVPNVVVVEKSDSYFNNIIAKLRKVSKSDVREFDADYAANDELVMI